MAHTDISSLLIEAATLYPEDPIRKRVLDGLLIRVQALLNRTQPGLDAIELYRLEEEMRCETGMDPAHWYEGYDIRQRWYITPSVTTQLEDPFSDQMGDALNSLCDLEEAPEETCQRERYQNDQQLKYLRELEEAQMKVNPRE